MGDKVEVISLKKGDYLVMWNDVVCELVDKKINLEEHTCTLTTIDAVKNNPPTYSIECEFQKMVTRVDPKFKLGDRVYVNIKDERKLSTVICISKENDNFTYWLEGFGGMFEEESLTFSSHRDSPLYKKTEIELVNDRLDELEYNSRSRERGNRTDYDVANATSYKLRQLTESLSMPKKQISERSQELLGQILGSGRGLRATYE